MTSSNTFKTRNPVARNLRANRPQVIPSKKITSGGLSMEKSKLQIIAEINGLCQNPVPLGLRVRMMFWRRLRLNRVLALANYHVKHYGRKIQN